MNRYSSVHRNKTKGFYAMDVRFQTIVLPDSSGNTYEVPLLLQGDGLGLTSRMRPYPGAQHCGEMPPLLGTEISNFVPESFKGSEDEAVAAVLAAIKGVVRRTGWTGIEFYRDDDGKYTLSLSFPPDSPYLHYEDQGDGPRLVRLHSGPPRETIKGYGWDRAAILALKPVIRTVNLIKDEVAYQGWRKEPKDQRADRPKKLATV